MNIYLALLLSVASFAVGWAMAKHLQKSTISAQEQARVQGQAIAVPFRYALSITEETPACMEWDVKHLNATTEFPKQTSLQRYEPS